MHLHLENEEFVNKLAREGHTLAFKHVDDSTDKEYDRYARKNEDIYAWIRQHYRESEGADHRELISASSSPLATVFSRSSGYH